MSQRLEEAAQLRRAAEGLAGQLADIRERIVRLEEDGFVQVNFIGHPKVYTYEMAPGHEAEIGDYVCVYSPMTRREELVQVKAKGRGPTLFGRSPKIARQVSVNVRRPTNVGSAELITDEAYDPFRGSEG